MKRVIVHGGHFKTGTTSAQYALAANRQRLSEAGILYPKLDEIYPHQHGAFLSFWDAARLPQLEAFWREQAARFRDAPEATMILSGEVIAKFTRENFAKFREIFDDFHLTLVFVLRHWAGFCPSHWQEHLRWGDALSFTEYVQRVAADFDASIDGDFSRPLRGAAGVFDRIAPAPYAVAEALPRLFRALELPNELVDDMSTAARVRENTSLSFLEREGARACNLILGDRRGRRVDSAYLITIDAATPIADLCLPRVREAFLASDLEGARKLRKFLLDLKQETPKQHWSGLFQQWTQRLNASLEAIGLDPMPEDWGRDEMTGVFAHAEFGLADLPPRTKRDYFDFIRQRRLAAQ